jgi:hypothetical protein
MVTHSSTSRPVQCLCMAERTGCPVLTDLWSYVLSIKDAYNIITMFEIMTLVKFWVVWPLLHITHSP